jgi:hypothetical protein
MREGIGFGESSNRLFQAEIPSGLHSAIMVSMVRIATGRHFDKYRCTHSQSFLALTAGMGPIYLQAEDQGCQGAVWRQGAEEAHDPQGLRGH